jgi:hypothetical protein
MTDSSTSAELFSRMDVLQQSLRDLLVSNSPAFAVRPPSGKWSVVENLCHLLFAEQAHLGRYLPEPPPWSRFALPPSGMAMQARFRELGQAPSSARVVLEEWAAIHEATRPLASNVEPKFVNRLERHVKHLNAHVKVIERLLRAQEKAKA